MNKVELIGRISTDIDLKFLPNTGKAVAKFNLAVDNPYKKTEDGKRDADFINIVVFGAKAESISEHMKKGRLLGVSGRISTRSYEANDGTKRYVTEVIADELDFIDWGGNKKPKEEEMTPIYDGEVPF